MAELPIQARKWAWRIGAAVSAVWMIAALYALFTHVMMAMIFSSGWPTNSDGNFDIDGVSTPWNSGDWVNFWLIAGLIFVVGFALPIFLLRAGYRWSRPQSDAGGLSRDIPPTLP